LEKELLLRATETFENSVSRKYVVTERIEEIYSEWLPVPCLRSIEGLISKVSISGPFEAIETLGVIQKVNRSHLRFPELLILLVEKAVEHR
jgi:hypothetical protein